jgi:hypothetical protein
MIERATLGVVLAAVLGLASPALAPAYDWPVLPFDHQHPIRGTFDDPRTRTGRVDRDPTNPQRFHDGVDIQVPDGTPVYAIESGEVTPSSRPPGRRRPVSSSGTGTSSPLSRTGSSSAVASSSGTSAVAQDTSTCPSGDSGTG